jgi:CxxC motif-containing protein (DUF1111 family)
MSVVLNLRAALVCLTLALSALGCVERLPVAGARCPCPKAGYCCDLSTLMCTTNALLCGEKSDGSPSPDVHPNGIDGGLDGPFIGEDGPTNETGIIIPPATCNQAGVPVAFSVHCGGCHTAAGPANTRYPDLYKFGSNAAAFNSRVRVGGNGMLAYSASAISDADLDAVYEYFHGQGRPVIDMGSLGAITPLFGPGDAKNPPIVFMRDDGAIVTRGAGRARNRHEANPSFMEYYPSYYTMRTYGWIVVDNGEKLTVSFMPNGTVTGNTNFRTWKAYDNNDVFAMNQDMVSNATLPDLSMNRRNFAVDYTTAIARFTQVQEQEVTTNRRTGAPLQAGDTCEFEFGIFYATDAIMPPGSRTSYYTDQFRYRVGKGGVTPDNVDSYKNTAALGPSLAAQQGGDTTNVWAYTSPELQFDQTALNIQHENIQSFVEGRRLFHTDFVDGSHDSNGVPAEGFPEQAGKGNAMAQQTACQGCHPNNGGGKTIEGTLEKASMTIRFGPGSAAALGKQLQPWEGAASSTSSVTKVVDLSEGAKVILSKPNIIATTKQYGAQPFSARVATRLIGLGLLEAIDERTILSRADLTDCDKDGISGRPSLVKDPGSAATYVGRFGWKGEKASLIDVAAEQAQENLDVSSSRTAGAELSEAELDKLVTFLRLLSVPGQRDVAGKEVAVGATLFVSAGCASCHATDVVTGPHHPFSELRAQSIKPYTDLLLHDMGTDLADQSAALHVAPSAMDPASSSEWRTPPLWGLGLAKTISGQVSLLHDGRAHSILEAILWHGGEAERSKQRVLAMPAADREALLAFLGSL